MQPIRVTLSSATVSNPIPLDRYISPFNVGLGVAISVGGSLTYSVQHTFDDVFSPTFNPATAAWFTNATLVAKTASADGNYAFPVTAIRLNVTTYISGSVMLSIVQAGLI